MTHGDCVRKLTDENLGKLIYHYQHNLIDFTEDEWIAFMKSEAVGFNGDRKEQTDALD